MNDKEQALKIMNDTAKSIKKMIDSKLSNKTVALTGLDFNALDNINDDVKKMRELQAVRLRAVIEELSDLKEIINAMYPDA
jgi:uncharacterized protein YlaN (UPF0358 family)